MGAQFEDAPTAVQHGMLVVVGLLLALWCAGRTRNIRLDEFGERPDEPAPAPITWRRRIAWMFFAFVPSSMLLAVTMNLTTDIASFPLLWIVPLAIYLLTMIAAFSGMFVSFAGDDFTAADIQMSYGIIAGMPRARLSDPTPNISAWRDRVESRPAYARAVEAGGPLVGAH